MENLKLDGGSRTLSLRLLLIFLLHVSIIIFMVVNVDASDPDPLVDIPTSTKLFVLRDLFTNGDVSRDTGGIRAAVNTGNFPLSESEGITYVRFRMVPCGVNLPHTHPRATELLTLLSGGPLQVGFVDTSGMSHINILYPGDVTLFPRGLLHFEINVGKTNAEYISALNSQNPGTLSVSLSLFQVPGRTLATSLNLPLLQVQTIKSTLFPYGTSLKMTHTSGCVPGKDITIDF